MSERSFNKPVEEGKEYEVEIKETSRRGDGVARIEGFVVFVPQTKPGDKVKVKINTVGPSSLLLFSSDVSSASFIFLVSYIENPPVYLSYGTAIR